MTKKRKNISNKGSSYVLPAQVRMFASTVAGNRDPISEKDFSESELQQMREAIARSRDRQSKYVEHQKSKGRQAYYDETVDYKDYGADRKRQEHTARDYSVLPSDAARNTLGRFRYEKTPEGRLVVTDSYDFKDDLVDKNPNIPRSKDYEKMSALGKIGKLAVDTLASDKGGFSTLPSRVGSAFVGAASRPVRIDLGEASFKKGGTVGEKRARTNSPKRGDGIATKGFTKGRVR